MITLEGDSLVFRFPDVHEHAGTAIGFRRTLRIPDDGKEYPLPPGLGAFPLRHVEDYAEHVPPDWRERNGVMMPLYQAEAMWISFGSQNRPYHYAYPCAIKVAAGKINAISGKPWKPELEASERDYIVVPDQPWLDGFCVAQDVIRQFVAMPLGSGYSVEEQITGKAEHGGLQIIAYPMKKERYKEWRRRVEEEERQRPQLLFALSYDFPRRRGRSMGLAAGGRMKQQIYADPHGIEAWERSVSSRCFVSLVDAVHWREITGEAPPTPPPTAAEYANAGLPWFDYYAADVETLPGGQSLALVKSVAEMAAEKGDQVLGPDGKVEPAYIIDLLRRKPTAATARPVREGKAG